MCHSAWSYFIHDQILLQGRVYASLDENDLQIGKDENDLQVDKR